MPANGILPMAPRNISCSLSFTNGLRERANLNQLQFFSNGAQLIEVVTIPVAESPIALFTQPTKRLIQPRRGESAGKALGSRAVPARLLVFEFAPPHITGTPPLREHREVDFAGGDGSRLPINWINHPAADENVVRIE